MARQGIALREEDPRPRPAVAELVPRVPEKNVRSTSCRCKASSIGPAASSMTTGSVFLATSGSPLRRNSSRISRTGTTTATISRLVSCDGAAVARHRALSRSCRPSRPRTGLTIDDRAAVPTPGEPVVVVVDCDCPVRVALVDPMAPCSLMRSTNAANSTTEAASVLVALRDVVVRVLRHVLAKRNGARVIHSARPDDEPDPSSGRESLVGFSFLSSMSAVHRTFAVLGQNEPS